MHTISGRQRQLECSPDPSKEVRFTTVTGSQRQQECAVAAMNDTRSGITNDASLQRELHIILSAFEAGLQTLLLRKPGWSEHAYARWLSFLPECYRQHVMVATYPALVESFGLKGLHLSEAARAQIAPYEIRKLRETGKWVSASMHDDATDTTAFDFVLQGPVFDSLSKTRHLARPFHHIPSNAIALGGVHEGNVLQARELGYCGAAVLGAVWQQPENANSTITQLINRWNQTT
ncbi:thiamine phosphate synthase [Chitinophaga pollutisoli]|uniref:Thiamine phosphate synthase n=1 Tax=Chitinophaga pollutisoli TaxID=3133966 RepID=A0ABZ2YGJ2_9BACT